MGKVRYGIENVHYALAEEDGWAAPKPLKGAVSLSVETEGQSSTFYADNTAYAVFEANMGYSGELEVACLDDDVAVDLLGYTKDTKDGVFEASDSKPKEFALLFQVKGNDKDQKFAFYECTLSRPAMNANTASESIEPDTITLPFKAVPHEMVVGSATMKVVKYSMELSVGNATEYGAWFTEVKTPNMASV